VTKVLVESDSNQALNNYDWDAFGWHRVSFLGDFQEKFRIAAILLGLDMIEEN